ncbi:hypothetical protein ABT336_11855 [Micromonospora sp. NPDC000207]|uniref:hypothetical protein n=1 Tax=Micromonospora sp. NPDC000207 TaxID=3154246 RepID=UPI0033346906
MDPVSIGVTIFALWAILQRSPQWVGELGEEWRAARRGEESPAAAARRQRLIDNGVDPASGGPMRQYVGNRWRDFWLDEDIKATRRRAERLDKEAAGEALSMRERWQSRCDDEVTRRAEGMRTKPADTSGQAKPTTATEPPTSDPNSGSSTPPAENNPPADTTKPAADAPRPRKSTDHTIPDDYDDEPPPVVHDDDTTYTHGSPPQPDNHRNPIRVNVTVGEPIRPHQPATPVAQITAGGTMSQALAPQAVTGVVSGAAEARAIQAALNQATDEYVATLTRLRDRIAHLGEQTLGTVQMSGRSQVIGNTAAAAEAAAAAVANARSCTSEVVPLLGNVARAFDRINS